MYKLDVTNMTQHSDTPKTFQLNICSVALSRSQSDEERESLALDSDTPSTFSFFIILVQISIAFWSYSKFKEL